MRKWSLLILAGTAASLGACDWLTARNDDEPPANEAPSAAGKAEAGQVAVKAPGFDVSFTVPRGLSRDVKVHSDIKILYPKAAITGMYAAAGSGKEEGKSEVELRFASADTPDRIADWYRDPARGALFKVESIGRQGADTLIRGRETGRGGNFSVRLAAKAGGGTDGRLVRREGH
jgi:hypothetical protein